MLRKISIVSVAAAVGLAFAIAAPSISLAKDPNPNKPHNKPQNKVVQKNVVVKQKVVQKNIHVKYVVGQKYNGHYWYGYNRHRWHGIWYAYGVGPCWINIDGLWFWNVAACPD